MPKNDDFEDESFFDRGSEFFRDVSSKELEHRWPAHLKFLFVLVAIFIISAVYWSLSSNKSSSTDPELANLPTLSPSPSPYRVKPEHSGGMEIPNRDSALYEAVEGRKTTQDSTIEAQLDSTAAETDETQAKEPSGLKNANSRFAGLEKTLKQKLHKAPTASETKDTSVSQKSENQLAEGPGSDSGPTSTQDNALPKIDKDQSRTRQDKNLEGKDLNLTDKQETKEQEVENLADMTISETEEAQKTFEQPRSKPAQTETQNISGLPTPSLKPESLAEAEQKTGQVQSSDKAIPKEVKEVVEGLADKKDAAQPGAKKGDYFVQLGSVSSPDKAEAEWKRLKSRYNSILSAQNHRIERADLGDRGVFHRIQAGPLPEDKAEKICAALKKAGKPGGCLVVSK